MPQAVTSRDDAADSQKLAYLETISQTKLGLRSSSRTLSSLRAQADANDTRIIDLQIDQNDSDWFRANQAEGAYYSRNVTFRPPTEEELEAMRKLVQDLDGIIASNGRIRDVIQRTTALVSHFNQTQG